ncbi:interleukin 21 receptor, tandem duplicate 1 isoform X2 [Triplophysa rosa]|uniref:Interleukin-21 receptor n=2 Tax=Triplophysa rosa TaxID=992332 RepID=A0A9W7TUS1_TRIRA|nr:interleukin 21 receptor, tandem duplicate 1 isoform X2 [Triplophysa rosa]XP_057201588.1 interleukin 21 receptor, tandem duplicate 1 isoform X2 [Triplophysa rosa]KAI7803384.1 putative interleukin-21 receptor [Triplophysa rosa]
MCLSRADHRFFHCYSMMALWQAITLFTVCGLIECNDSVCDVTCTTDFISTLNCSISDSAGTASCYIVANCSDESGAVEGNCSMKSSQSWCTIESEELQAVMTYDTTCSITATPMTKQGGAETPITKNMLLYKSIKLIQPYNLSVEKMDGGFNLTWDVVYRLIEHELYEKLYYRVRLRTKGDSIEKENIFTLDQTQQSMGIASDRLLPGRRYVADVQVAVHPSGFKSTWSEWSSSVEWTCDSPGSENYYFLLLMAVPIVVVLVVLLYNSKLRGVKKMSLWQHIPSPQDYFKPLYHTYQGDFKKWVGPVLTFNNFDVLEKSATLLVLSDRQQTESSEEPANNRNSQQRDSNPFNPASQNSSKLYFLGSSSHVFTHSSGHISMDTVTVSGQEGLMADWSGESHRRSIDDFHNGTEADQRVVEMADGQPGALLHDGRGRIQVLDCDDWHIQDHELENVEQVSLFSYSSNEHSDDGYPQMGLDLDTIDSGFLESDCSSPSGFDGKEHTDTESLEGVGVFQSNYVKQWVTFTAVQVDNSTEN